MSVHMLEISKCAAANTHLGPAGARFCAVWLWGCERGCAGCIASDWNANPPEHSLSPEFLVTMLLDGEEPDGIVISGGEPFRQAEGVGEFLSCADRLFSKKPGIMIYTGYTLEELRQAAESRPEISAILDRTDVLIDGAYIKALDDDRAFRGSSNQRILFLSDRYSAADFPPDTPRESAIRSEYGEIILSGIPSEADRRIWYALRGGSEETAV